MKLFNLAFLILFITSCKSQSQSYKPLAYKTDNNSLLWEVSGNGLKTPSYLFGTFHLLCKDDIQFSANLKTAIQNTSFVFMELKMDDPEMLNNSLPFLVMKNNITLKDIASATDYEKLNSFFNDSLHIPLMMMQSVKPFFLEAMLYPKMLSCPTPSGVEEELLKIIKADKKQIRGLETIQFQAGIFDSIPYKDQISELIKSIRQMDSSKAEFQTMVSIYKKQQLDILNDITAKEEGITKQYNQILLVDRNKNWVNILKQQMPVQSVFVAVGAAHLGGASGLLNLLKSQGFKVNPVINY